MRKITHEEFIEEFSHVTDSIEVIGTYNGRHERIECKCLKCGNIWNPIVGDILNGHGCPKCALKSRSRKRALGIDELKERVAKTNPRVKITGTDYVNKDTPIDCECLVCGNKMKKRPCVLLRGGGCEKCGNNQKHDACCFSHDEFVARLQDVNPNIEAIGKYYNGKSRIKVRCKICGHSWNPTALSIMYEYGRGCPKCYSSKGETKLAEILKEYNINFDEQHKFKECTVKKPLRFDAYDLENNIAYEYQGEQHYMPIDFSGRGKEWAEENLKNTQARDNVKRRYCEEHGIPLIEIPYWERDNMRDFLIDKWKELELDIA